MANKDNALFIERIKHAKIDLKMTNADIAKLTGYKVNSIDSFMTGRGSEQVANCIAKVLHIER